ncbi:hypothetical protein BCS71_18310 [Vibrio lentus]|uniref:hypothetical protein n=1 Tax=Vibrio lentus TaxID=136468 RepID=UPI000C8511B7|nr:hypothetical protein [Vibrio lentus]PMI61333.1 hypothetical protein BCU41_16715 [Vibrio lentus]PMI90908.1 hypothetical protein BCU35_19970 [Vibrio lentus]
MSDINEEYYVLVCGSGKVPSPYISCSKSPYLTFREPASLKMPIQVEGSAEEGEEIPLIEAMAAPSDPVLSKRITKVLEYFDLYKVQLLPAAYTHNDNSQHVYSVLLVDNDINAYDFDSGKYLRKSSDGEVLPDNCRLDEAKLSNISLEKRSIFRIRGMSDFLVHKSIAEPLIALNASGLHLVPLLEWDIGFGMTI